MEHLIELSETKLALLVAWLRLGLEAIAVFCVLIGLVKTLQLAIALFRRSGKNQRNGSAKLTSPKLTLVLLRLRFGVWLAIALEFQLGADIVSTTVAPTFEALGKLAMIAAIRTFLNYFLNQELNAEFKSHRGGESEHTTAPLTH